MEKLILFIFVNSLFSGACSLSCYQCTPDGQGPCKDTKMDCPSNQCGSLRVVSYAGGSKVSDLSIKSCVVPQQCITGSVNLGLMKTTIDSKCCKTDLCNAQIPEPTGGVNGKECYTCNGNDCLAKMKCEGLEDRCVISKIDLGGQKMVVKGCASKSACAGALADQIGSSLGEMTCCEGNLCNGISRVTGSADTNKNSITIMGLSLVLVLFY